MGCSNVFSATCSRSRFVYRACHLFSSTWPGHLQPAFSNFASTFRKVFDSCRKVQTQVPRTILQFGDTRRIHNKSALYACFMTPNQFPSVPDWGQGPHPKVQLLEKRIDPVCVAFCCLRFFFQVMWLAS